MKLILPSSLAALVEPRLAEVAPDCQVVHMEQDGALDGDIADAEALLRWWTTPEVLRRTIEAAPALRWIHTPSAGVDGLLLPELVERGIVLTNSTGAHAIPIAEFVLMFLLGHAKQVRRLAALTAENAWSAGQQLHLNELYGRTLLIIGLGHIGSEIARRAAAFGMRVVGSRRSRQPVEGVDQVVGENGWRDLLPQADDIVISAPLTAATRGMLDAAAFGRMKPGAYLVNIARGQIIDTDALLAALHAGQLAGAALDALPEEPLPADHPFWQAPNVWITPHISWSSPHIFDRATTIFLENLRRYQVGAPLLNQVDPEAGY